LGIKEGDMKNMIIEYDVNEAHIAKVNQQYGDIELVPDDSGSYAMVMAGLKAHREVRLAIEAKRKANNEGARTYIKANDARGKELHALNDPGEARLKAIRKVEDDRIEAIQLKAERIERERVEGILDRIKAMEFAESIEDTASSIKVVMDKVADTMIDDSFAEFKEQAVQVKKDTFEILFVAHQKHLAHEERLAEQKAEAERLEKVAKEQAAAQAKIEAEQKKIADEKAKIEAAKKAEHERKGREAFEKKVKADAEQAARDKLVREALERKEKEEAEAAEKARKESLRPDKEKLIVWAGSLWKCIAPGNLPELVSGNALGILEKAESGIRTLLNSIRKDVEAL